MYYDTKLLIGRSMGPSLGNVGKIIKMVYENSREYPEGVSSRKDTSGGWVVRVKIG